jgi:hypothetical protein
MELHELPNQLDQPIVKFSVRCRLRASFQVSPGPSRPRIAPASVPCQS